MSEHRIRSHTVLQKDDRSDEYEYGAGVASGSSLQVTCGSINHKAADKECKRTSSHWQAIRVLLSVNPLETWWVHYRLLYPPENTFDEGQPPPHPFKVRQ